MTVANKTLKFGIIGTGSIAGHHIKSLQELENCTLVALASSSIERASIAKTKYNVPTYPSYEKMLHSADIDAVIICTQSGNHLEPTLASALSGKHILVEKPLEVTEERALQMISASEKANVQLSCIFQNRFSPDFLKLKEAVKSGLLGKLLMGNAFIPWYRKPSYYSTSFWKGTVQGDGGAAFINQGIHTIDLLLNIMGPVHSVIGKTKTIMHDIEGEDIGAGIITFNNGALGNIHASTALYPGYPERIEIYGDKGSVILEAGKITQWNILNAKDKGGTIIEKVEASGSSDPMAISHTLHKAQIENFASSILSNTTPEVSGSEGLKAMQLILKLYQSSKEGREIKF